MHYRAAKDGYLWRKGAERTKWKYAEDWVATHGDSWSIFRGVGSAQRLGAEVASQFCGDLYHKDKASC